MDRDNLRQAKAQNRYLSPLDVWAIAFGCMVGWGVFAIPGTTFLPVAGPAGTLIAFAIGTVIMLIVGGCFSYLMGHTSIAGGVYSYAKEAFGRDHAFLSAWFLCLSYLTIVFLNGTALFFVARTLFSGALQSGPSYVVAGNTIFVSETVLSVLVLSVVAVLFVAARTALQKLHTALSVVLFAGVLIIAVACLPRAISAGALRSFGTRGLSPAYAVFSLVIMAPWAFVGFGYTSAAAYKLARIEGNRRVTVMGLMGTIISEVFAVVQLVPRLAAMEAMGSEAFLILSLWCLLGFVFYWRTVIKSTLTEYSGISTSGVVLFALLTYSALMWLAKRMMQSGTLEATRSTLAVGGVVAMVIIFVGLAVMLYVQNVVRKKHEAVEREKIHAVESSLAKSQFLFNMSHDIRTPMNAIIGYTHLAMKELDPAVMQDYLGKIDTSSQHLLSLINDILEMSRIESGKIELELMPVDLRAVFNGMRDLFSEQMRQKEMDFQVHTGQVKNPYVWCDRKNLNRVLLNILSNTYKFTPEHGTVTASLWEVGLGENGYGAYEIRVQDSGIGMSREFSERMFNAFERERTSTASGVQGTGLGLAITKRIVDLMGGTIEVLTSPGAGTEIIIRLKFKLAEPSEVAEDERADTPAPGRPEVDFTKKRLLLVEDNAINMEIANMILTQAGFMTDMAENGQIAVDKVAASEPGFYDAILMDIQMPVMNGYEATRAIRALDNPKLASIPILAMTANAFKEDENAAREAGMQDHIAKPIDVARLMQALTDVLK